MANRVTGLAGDPALDVTSVQGVVGGTPIPVSSSSSGSVANTTYTTVQVSPTGTAGTLIAASATRKELILRALSSNTASVFVGAATVSAVTGMEIKPGEQLAFSGSSVPAHLLQAISSSGTQTVIVTTGV